MIRTAAGDAFTSFVVDVAGLGHFLTDAGETLARHGDLSLARWVVLDAVSNEPLTVAQIARVRGMARQPVQRIADALVDEGLASFKDNPKHRRARLLAPTAPGRGALEAITGQQVAWADAHGTRIRIEKLERARKLIAEIRPLIEPPPEP